MAETFREPQSANEALLQNILGADNVTREPQSVTEYYLKKIAEQGTGGSTHLYMHFLLVAICVSGSLLSQVIEFVFINDWSGQYDSLAEALYKNGYKDGYAYNINIPFYAIDPPVAGEKNFYLLVFSVGSKKSGETYSLDNQTCRIAKLTDSGTEMIFNGFLNPEIRSQRVIQIS